MMAQKLFLAGFAQQRILYWPLGTDYDIDTEGTLGFFDLTPYKSGSDFKPRDVDFNSDGTRMYVVDRLDRIVVFKLDNADLSSGVTELDPLIQILMIRKHFHQNLIQMDQNYSQLVMEIVLMTTKVMILMNLVFRLLMTFFQLYHLLHLRIMQPVLVLPQT